MARRRWHRAGATMGAVALLSSLAAGTTMAGNNGTIKIHEAGTPSGTPNNDPKVCSFNVEGFGFDDGQGGYLVFSVQGGDAPTGSAAGPLAVPAANSSGYFETGYFSLDPGHYKATLYGKADQTDVKAKSKVFKVTCEGEGGGGGEGGGDVG